jgi:hypothetical protein
VGRVVNPEGVGKQRSQLLKLSAIALRALAGCREVSDEARDLVAFIAMTLNEVHETVDVACQAWEKRDYWLKADRFRRDWAWAGRIADKLERVTLGDEWQKLPELMADLGQHLDGVKMPKGKSTASPWKGAHMRLRQLRGVDEFGG